MEELGTERMPKKKGKKGGKDTKKKKKKTTKKKSSVPVLPGATPQELLQRYKVSCKNIGIEPDDVVLKALGKGTSNESKFDELAIGDQRLGPAGARAIAEALLGDESSQPFVDLYALRLWRTCAKDDGAVWLSRFLQEAKDRLRIRTVDLIDNDIGPRGAMHLGNALARGGYANVTRLSLEHNASLGSKGCEELCRGLATNSSLKELYLGHCNIGSDGGKYIAQLLCSQVTQLSKLDLKCNDIGSRGIRFLCLSLKRNLSLAELSLFDNNIGGFPPTKEDLDAFEKLGEALAVNSTLSSLDLDLNYLGETGALALSEGLEKNTGLRCLTLDYTLEGETFARLTELAKAGKKSGKCGKKKKTKKKKKKKK